MYTVMSYSKGVKLCEIYKISNLHTLTQKFLNSFILCIFSNRTIAHTFSSLVCKCIVSLILKIVINRILISQEQLYEKAHVCIYSNQQLGNFRREKTCCRFMLHGADKPTHCAV